MAEKSPAFQMYARDFLTDEKVALMSLSEVGAYTLLLCHAWLEGSIPDDPSAAAKLCRVPAGQMKKAWTHLRECWQPSDDGRLINPRQERERDQQAMYREQQARAGRISGESRRRTAFERRSHSVRTDTPTKTKSASASASALDPEASVKDSTVVVSNGELPPALIPLRESLRAHGEVIGREPDLELIRKIAEASLNQPLTAASWIGKTWLRRFSEHAVHRQPAPESLAYWVTAIREEAAGGWRS